jgi:hypothetical protein
VGGAPEAAALVSFESLAALFLPAQPAGGGIVMEAGEGWNLDPADVRHAVAVVWGRPALPSGRSLSEGLGWMVARERAIARLRRTPPGDLRVTAVRRLPPARLDPGSIRNRLRDVVRAGALVELWRGPRGTRAIDAAVESAGARELTGFRPGSGGSALARYRAADGVIGVIRLGAAGGPADPTAAADALERLAPFGLACVPRLIGRGRASGVGWSTETLLAGGVPPTVGPALAARLASFCAALPLAEGPPRAHRAHLATVSKHIPGREPALLEAARACEDAAPSAPGIMGHNDLWAGNLLVDGETLTGVIDWDGWHPAGFPGGDLLHAIATDEGRRLGLGIGGVWLRRPWCSERFTRVAAPYWRALDVGATDPFLHAVGIAWWACQVATTLERLPHLAADDRWVDQNVDAVLSSLAG